MLSGLRTNRRRAEIEIAVRMSAEQWATYRDGTTAKLAGIAQRRAEMLEALSELSWFGARLLGRAAERVLK
jgi:hypothetical protein